MTPLEPPLGRDLILGVFPPYFVYTMIIVLAIALILFWLTRTTRRREDAIEILKRRYARGEIDLEEFQGRKRGMG